MTTTETGTVKVGDVFVESWGYDQTNINFYEAVGITPSGKSVKLRAIESKMATEQTGGPGADYVVPMSGAFLTPPEHIGSQAWRYGKMFTKRLGGGHKHGPYVSMSSYSGAWLWNGKPQYQTAMGWGH